MQMSICAGVLALTLQVIGNRLLRGNRQCVVMPCDTQCIAVAKDDRELDASVCA
jgi:hypothetical protein